MPKRITVEVDALAYDSEAAQTHRTLQPLTLSQEVTIEADSDPEAIVRGLRRAADFAAIRPGHADQLRAAPACDCTAECGDDQTISAPPEDDGCTCERGICQLHVDPVRDRLDKRLDDVDSKAFGGSM
jgi:hypothetical protein